jgi:hypothetical protein
MFHFRMREWVKERVLECVSGCDCVCVRARVFARAPGGTESGASRGHDEAVRANKSDRRADQHLYSL